MSPDDPTEPGTSDSYVREEQHGPEMDDTQVRATGELSDQLDPVAPDDGPDDSRADADPPREDPSVS